MSYQNISSAMIAQLKTACALPLATANKSYMPDIGSAYAKVSEFFLPSLVTTMGAGGDDRLDGIFQVSLYYPADKGRNDAYIMAQSIRDAFKAHTPITGTGVIIDPVSTELKEGEISPSWYNLILIVRWYSIVSRGA